MSAPSTNDVPVNDPQLALVARTAAKWWRNVVADGASLDNGATDSTNMMAMAVAGKLQADALSQITPEQLDRFESMLAQEVLCQLQAQGEGCRVNIAVDYDPCPALYEAATGAGIKCSMTLFPWKTWMIVNRCEVSVACGYGAPLQPVPLVGEVTP